MSRLFGHPLAPVIGFGAGLTAIFCIYVVAGVSMAPEFELLAGYGWALVLVLWVDQDARINRRVPCLDFGLYLVLFWPLSALWYCCWSRGWSGVLLVFLLAVLWLVPQLVAVTLLILLYGPA